VAAESEGGKPSARAASLQRRVYKTVSVASAGADAAFALMLDGKPARTPGKERLAVPSRGIAEALAAEWQAQADRVDPATMPLTRLVNTVIDGVRGREAEVRDDIVKYAGSDLVCYRAQAPEQLVRRQAAHWDPVLAWARQSLSVSFATGVGLMPVRQPEAATAAVARSLAKFDVFALGALHVMTTLMGSALLALAHAGGGIGREAAWAAAHVDEDFQISQWGEDGEAAARRNRRWQEMQAASCLLDLLRAG
jgi:chaperone required for assembly of F1-ATPase